MFRDRSHSKWWHFWVIWNNNIKHSPLELKVQITQVFWWGAKQKKKGCAVNSLFCTRYSMRCLNIMNVSKPAVIYQWEVSPPTKQFHNTGVVFFTRIIKYFHEHWHSLLFFTSASSIRLAFFFSFFFLLLGFERLTAATILPLNKLSSFNSHSREILSVLR